MWLFFLVFLDPFVLRFNTILIKCKAKNINNVSLAENDVGGRLFFKFLGIKCYKNDVSK